jgi:hypothetical protein
MWTICGAATNLAPDLYHLGSDEEMRTHWPPKELLFEFIDDFRHLSSGAVLDMHRTTRMGNQGDHMRPSRPSSFFDRSWPVLSGG